MTILTFLAGVGLYIAATWGSGEGWFGRPVVDDEEGKDGKGRVLGEKPAEITADGGLAEKMKEKGQSVDEVEKGKGKEKEEGTGRGTGVGGCERGVGRV